MFLLRTTAPLQRLFAHARHSRHPNAAPQTLVSIKSSGCPRYPVRYPHHYRTNFLNATVASMPLAGISDRSSKSLAGPMADRFQGDPFFISHHMSSFHNSADTSSRDRPLRCCSSAAQPAQAPICSKVAEYGNVIIRDPEELERKKSAMRVAGLNKLQVIADFDMTLTRFRINGERGLSCHSIIKTDDEGINAKRRQVHDKYYPMEIDPTITKQDKLPLMEAWWTASHSLILEGGVSLKGIQEGVGCANIAFRDGTEELLEALNEMAVPVLIFSAGIADVIEEVMRQKLRRQVANVKVVSNRMEFDEGGRVRGFKGRLIHVLNKNEHALELASSPPSLPTPTPTSAPASETHNQQRDQNGASSTPSDSTSSPSLKNRTNVILLGDHMGDLRMSDGVNYEHRITIGFLNDNVEAQLEEYTSAFDIVVLNDGPMDVVLDLVHGLH